MVKNIFFYRNITNYFYKFRFRNSILKFSNFEKIFQAKTLDKNRSFASIISQPQHGPSTWHLFLGFKFVQHVQNVVPMCTRKTAFSQLCRIRRCPRNGMSRQIWCLHTKTPTCTTFANNIAFAWSLISTFLHSRATDLEHIGVVAPLSGAKNRFWSVIGQAKNYLDPFWYLEMDKKWVWSLIGH